MSKGNGVYLVGGYLRDILRGVQSQDRDYVIYHDLESFIHQIYKLIGGTIVVFEKGKTIRIALKNGITLDFSKISGSIEEDLSKRDFTINALAWSPERGIVDIYNSLNDIRMRIIRCTKKENLLSDPLRILRAYRFAALLNGDIERKTRKLLKPLSNKIKSASSERITLELFHLLNSEHSSKYLKMALYDGVLNKILCNPSNVLYDNLRVIYKLETSTRKAIPANLKVLLNKTFSQNLSYKGLLCIEILMKNRQTDKNTCYLIKISKRIRKRIELVQRGFEVLRNKNIDLQKKTYEIFSNTKEASVDLIIIEGKLDLLNEYRRFQRIGKRSILRSNEIMNISGIKGGKNLGHIIRELRKAEFEGKIKNRDMAFSYIENIKDNILHNIYYQT